MVIKRVRSHRHAARRLDAQQPEAPSRREMLAAVHQVGRKKASVDAVMSALVAGVARPAAWSAADDHADDVQLQHPAQPQGAQASPPLSLEAHIQAHQGQLPVWPGASATAPPAGRQSWKRRFWELHRELVSRRDGQRQADDVDTQQRQPPWRPQQPQAASQQPYAAPGQVGHLVGTARSAPEPAQPVAAAQHADGAVSNVVPFRPAASPPKRGGLGGPDDPDPRPIVLFDLNGTLTSHTASRRSAGTNKMRPGTPHLRRLQVCCCAFPRLGT